jgi:tetratricopeptide (TPR) repeat protein
MKNRHSFASRTFSHVFASRKTEAAARRARRSGLSLLMGSLFVAAVAGCSGGESTSGAPGGAGSGPGGSNRTSGGGARLAYQSALNLIHSNSLDEAEKELRRAIELNPAMVQAHFELGQLLVRQSYVIVGSGSRDQEKLDEGIVHLKRALEFEPGNDVFAYWVGRAAHIGEDLEMAGEYLDRAIALNPKNGLAHKRKGLLSMDQSELESACGSLETALELLPNDGGLRFQYGNALENIDQPERALAAYEQAIAVDPTLSASYNSLARLRDEAGDNEGAQEALRKFVVWQRWEQELQAAQRKVQRRPDDPQALFFLGEQFFAAERWVEALQWFNRVLSIDKRHAHAHLYCGIARRHIGDLDFSVDHLEEAAFLSPDSLEPKLELIRTCKLADKEDRILEILKQVEEEAPQDAYAYFELGRVCAQLERTEDARRYLERTLELDPTHEGARALLGGLPEAGGQ